MNERSNMNIPRTRVRFMPMAFCALLICHAAAGQQSAPQNAKLNSTTKSKPAKKKRHGILALVPTYGVTSASDHAPLTPRQKFHLAVAGFVSPFAVVEAAAKAEYYRGIEPPIKIGYGDSGYVKQWGASYLDEVSGNMFNFFLYPTLLHQDPRYYRKGKGPIVSRVAYSFSRIFVTRSDEGREQFNASMVLGSATSTFLSSAYYPPRAHSVGIIIGNIGWSLLGDGAGNIFNEFWPDIARRIHR